MREQPHERSQSRDRRLKGTALTAYGMLRGTGNQDDIVNAVTAHGAKHAADERAEYSSRWHHNVSNTKGFWSKLRAIIIG